MLHQIEALRREIAQLHHQISLKSTVESNLAPIHDRISSLEHYIDNLPQPHTATPTVSEPYTPAYKLTYDTDDNTNNSEHSASKQSPSKDTLHMSSSAYHSIAKKVVELLNVSLPKQVSVQHLILTVTVVAVVMSSSPSYVLFVAFFLYRLRALLLLVSLLQPPKITRFISQLKVITMATVKRSERRMRMKRRT